jgi:hypothetical protein
MLFEAILHEVDQLHNVSTRLEGLAEQHPPVSEALMTNRGKRSQHRHYLGSRGGD